MGLAGELYDVLIGIPLMPIPRGPAHALPRLRLGRIPFRAI